MERPRPRIPRALLMGLTVVLVAIAMAALLSLQHCGCGAPPNEPVRHPQDAGMSPPMAPDELSFTLGAVHHISGAQPFERPLFLQFTWSHRELNLNAELACAPGMEMPATACATCASGCALSCEACSEPRAGCNCHFGAGDIASPVIAEAIQSGWPHAQAPDWAYECEVVRNDSVFGATTTASRILASPCFVSHYENRTHTTATRGEIWHALLFHEFGHAIDHNTRDASGNAPSAALAVNTQNDAYLAEELWADQVAGCLLSRSQSARARTPINSSVRARFEELTRFFLRPLCHAPAPELRTRALERGWNACLRDDGSIEQVLSALPPQYPQSAH